MPLSLRKGITHSDRLRIIVKQFRIRGICRPRAFRKKIHPDETAARRRKRPSALKLHFLTVGSQLRPIPMLNISTHEPDVPLSPAVVITGASSGIGKACALHLDARGFSVFAGIRREEDGLSLQRKASPRLIPIVFDVTVPDSIETARRTVVRALASPGTTLSLVNNAGVVVGGPLEFLSADDLRKELDVNLVGVVQVTQAFLPLIRRSGGRIVNMSSTSGLIALPFLGAYAATKFALEAISDSWRVELRPWRIMVSLIEPGDVATPLWTKSLRLIDRLMQRWPEQATALYGPVIATREDRLNEHGIAPEEVAKVVGYALTSPHPRSRYRVGRNRMIIDLLRRLPIAFRDRLIASQLPRYGIPR
jgi:NAD(P)-dependent dehydrogenase (short-subunit alcohol dehydrogenase family)